MLHDYGDVRTLASHLERWARDPDALAMARRSALDAARTQWNAETEGEKIVAAVNRLFSRSPRQALASGQ